MSVACFLQLRNLLFSVHCHGVERVTYLGKPPSSWCMHICACISYFVLRANPEPTARGWPSCRRADFTSSLREFRSQLVVGSPITTCVLQRVFEICLPFLDIFRPRFGLCESSEWRACSNPWAHFPKLYFSLSQGRDCCFKGHTDTVDQLTWHPIHPDRLATASSDKTVRLWDARSNKCSSVIPTKGKVRVDLLGAIRKPGSSVL